MEKILRIVVLLTVAANSIFAAAQSPDTAKRWRWIAEPQFDYAFPFIGQLAAVKVDSLWGFIDTTGKFVIEPRFDDIGSLFNNVVERESTAWLLFEKSTMMIGLIPIHPDGRPWNDGVRSKYLAVVGEGQKLGFIDTSGRVVVEPQFAFAVSHSDSGHIYIEDTASKWGLLDAKGNFLIEPMFDQITAIDSSFSSMTLNGKYGLISAAGKIIAQPIYDDVIPYDDSQVLARRGDSLVAIDQKGGVSNFASPNNLPKRVSIIACAGRYGLAGADGKVLVEPSYSEIWKLSDGSYITLRGGLFGIIDPMGVVVSEPIYSKIEEIGKGYLEVSRNSKVGLAHPARRVMFASICDDMIASYGDTVMMGRIGNKIVTVDLQGKVTVLFKAIPVSTKLFYEILDEASESESREIRYYDNYAITEDQKVIDKEGNVVYAGRDNTVYHCGDGRFIVLQYFLRVQGKTDHRGSLFGYLEIIK